MINGLFFVMLAFVIVGGPYFIRRAREWDRRALAEYHLLHGPKSGCIECEGK